MLQQVVKHCIDNNLKHEVSVKKSKESTPRLFIDGVECGNNWLEQINKK